MIRKLCAVAAVVAALCIVRSGIADDFKPEEGFESLFNGKDLTGWKYGKDVLDGKTESADGRYKAIDGILTVTDQKGIRQLWTVREFPKEFHLKLEFRAGKNADSGLFLRKPQLQVRDYPRAGPYKMLQNYKDGDWNEIEVRVKAGEAYCTCNGEVLEKSFKLPETGPIGLEADRGVMEYRRIRIKEMK